MYPATHSLSGSQGGLYCSARAPSRSMTPSRQARSSAVGKSSLAGKPPASDTMPGSTARRNRSRMTERFKSATSELRDSEWVLTEAL